MVNSDVDFNESIDKVKVPDRPQAKLKPEWKGPVVSFDGVPGAPDAQPSCMPGTGTAADPPDPYDGWTERDWAESDPEAPRPDWAKMGPAHMKKGQGLLDCGGVQPGPSPGPSTSEQVLSCLQKCQGSSPQTSAEAQASMGQTG